MRRQREIDKIRSYRRERERERERV